MVGATSGEGVLVIIIFTVQRSIRPEDFEQKIKSIMLDDGLTKNSQKIGPHYRPLYAPTRYD